MRQQEPPSAASWDWQEEEEGDESDAGSGTKVEIAGGREATAAPSSPAAGAMSTSITMGPSSGSSLKRGALRPGHAGSPFGRAPMLAACALVTVTMLLGYQHYTHAAQRRQMEEELAFQRQKYRLLEQEKRELNIKNEAVQADQQSVQAQKAAALERQKSAERENESLQGKVTELEEAKKKSEGELSERINVLMRNHSTAISEIENRLQEESIQLRKDLATCRDNVTGLLEQLADAAALQARTASVAGAIDAVPPARSEVDLRTVDERKPSAAPRDEAGGNVPVVPDVAGAQADGADDKAAGADTPPPAAGAEHRIAFASDRALDDGDQPPAPKSKSAEAGRQLQFVRAGAKGERDGAITFAHRADTDGPIVFERHAAAVDGGKPADLA